MIEKIGRLALPVGVAEDRALRSNGIAQRPQDLIGAADHRTDAAQACVHQYRVPRLEAERAKVSREAGPRRGSPLAQLVAPA
jgi:hypothetical protein